MVYNSWKIFIRKACLEEGGQKTLQPACTQQQLLQAEQKLGFGLPLQLKLLWLINNGQNKSEQGLFKNVSGADLYTRAFFLSIDEALLAWKKITGTQEYVEEFKNEWFPFACEHEDRPGACFAISLATHKIAMLWTDLTGFDPPGWDLWCIHRANSLEEFLYQQSLMWF